MRSMNLDDKYTLEEGVIYATGVQALARLPLDQQRLDARRGLRTAGFVSGYQGSPLGTYDLTLGRIRALLERHDIVHVPGVNEELAATSVLGSQLTHVFEPQKYDGVVGYWYGKSPGVDRSGDALKHANFIGTKRQSGAILFAGDDPVAKSSTLPCGSESALATFGMPVLYPGNTQEVLDLGLHAVAMSRFCGSWVALKMVNNVCDGGGTAEVAPERIEPREPDFEMPRLPAPPGMGHVLVPAVSVPLEQFVFEHRLEAALAYARANRLDRIVCDPPSARLGLVAAGETYRAMRQALADMGLDQAALERCGVRLLELGMIYPLDPEIVRTFARDLEEIVVVEEKVGFLERQLKSILYDEPRRPRVLGKRDADGATLFPLNGGLEADAIALSLAPLLAPFVDDPGVERRPEEIARAAATSAPIGLDRANNFCSGCPHSRSTLLLEGQIAGGGIGCHTMAALTGQRERSIAYVAQMGGEGAVWIGASRFVERGHIFQNLGDGTYFHSGRLAVAAAVASGVNMTFKILYNSHVAMTGGQDPAGGMGVPAMTHDLRAMGVERIYLVTEQYALRKRHASELAPGVSIYPREAMEEVLRLCGQEPGVSALVFEQPCAAEQRRKRRRGLVETPSRHVIIDPDVCEGCGDCGVKSNCMSVVPIETEMGRKTAVHLSSCNQDESCLAGDCPAFVLVETTPAGGLRRRQAREDLAFSDRPLEEPVARGMPADGYRILITGVGGTGVVTINALLATAAVLDGKHCATLDQIGLAQKGGAVVSSVVIGERPIEGSNVVSAGRADLVLGLDLVGVMKPQNLSRLASGRTTAVLNRTAIATADMIRDRTVEFPAQAEFEAGLDGRLDAERSRWVDAGHLAETLFGDHMMTNTICLGAAYQEGWLPVSAAALEEAIRLNGVAVDSNLAAFTLGRCLVTDPESLERFTRRGSEAREEARAEALEELAAAGAKLVRAHARLLEGFEGSAELRRLVEIRVAWLLLYQDESYAERYLEFFDELRRALPAERAVRDASSPDDNDELLEAVARYLYKLMANKDEYEVARLHLRDKARERVESSFEGVRRTSVLLLPPFLRRLGLERKLAFGPGARPLLALLARLKRLRGTPLDLFGKSPLRRLERSLPDWYRDLVLRSAAKRTPENRDLVLELARLPDDIRGYEDIRLRSIERAKARAEELLGALEPEAQRLTG